MEEGLRGDFSPAECPICGSVGARATMLDHIESAHPDLRALVSVPEDELGDVLMDDPPAAVQFVDSQDQSRMVEYVRRDAYEAAYKAMEQMVKDNSEGFPAGTLLMLGAARKLAREVRKDLE